MDESSQGAGEHTPVHRGIGGWILFWVQFGVLGLCAILGAFFASQGGGPGDYGCGLALSLSAILVAFMRLKAWFDSGETDWNSFLLVDTMQNLWVVIPLFTILGLAGLFIAAGWELGSLHDAGITLFIVSALIVFLSLKRVFDRLDAQR
jgi:hypothetical protein